MFRQKSDWGWGKDPYPIPDALCWNFECGLQDILKDWQNLSHLYEKTVQKPLLVVWGNVDENLISSSSEKNFIIFNGILTLGEVKEILGRAITPDKSPLPDVARHDDGEQGRISYNEIVSQLNELDAEKWARQD